MRVNVTLTPAHWLYVIGVVVVILTMVFRRNVVIPCIIFTFAIGWYFKGDIVSAVQTVFNASLVAAQSLFSIFLIIAIMVALLKSLSSVGADQLLVQPMKGLMVSPTVSYLVVVVATVIISLFFWPTPAVPLIGALLVPAAVAAGLPPMLAAMALALAGQGMSLAGDVVIQGAPGLTAGAAGVDVAGMTATGGILTLITGIVALTLAYFFNRKEIGAFKAGGGHEAYMAATANNQTGTLPQPGTPERSKANALAIILAVVMVGVIVALFVVEPPITGGDASALLGGAALGIMLVASLLVDGVNGLDKMADYIADGLVFAFKVMGPILPIAGFFFLGGEDVVKILGEGAPSYLFDVGQMLAQVIPPTGLLAGFGLLILGAITGLDGSGFSGLPLVGTLAGAMAGGDATVATTLGAIGQMGSIWVGGGTLIAWSSLVAVAGICGVPVLDLVRKNLLPVVIGLVVSTVFGVWFLM